MGMAIPKLIESARIQLKETTGLDHSSTIGIKKENDNWRITLEMIEKHSIPDQMDILALYEAILDDNGNLLEFNRKNLRRRLDTENIESEE